MTRLSLSLALVLSLLSCGGEQATAPSADVEDSQGEDSGGLGEVCVPDCSGKPCGEADGCQGLCGGVQADSGDPEAATLS
ncbi:MAG: hypothetical protein VYE15_08305, partial [Myxococcota bacterium]|nr:hypothetical protein [Myxococcota bacterium]